MSKVLMLNSTYETCGDAIDKIFEEFPIDLKNKRVCIKVNGLKAGDPHEVAYVTDYRLLEKVIKKVESYGPKSIVIGDGVGTESYGKSDEVFEKTHLKETAGKYYKNFNKDLKVLRLEKPFHRSVAVLKDVETAEVYIALPKMKTHGLTRISGAIKINYGMLTGAQKSYYHYKCIDPKKFAQIVVEMYKMRKPDLVIMDAIMAMEGYGPGSPEVNHVGKVIGGTDCVAIDTAMADMIGFTVDDVPYLQICRDEKLGETDLSKIEIVGDNTLKTPYHLPDPPEASYSYKSGVGSGKCSIDFYRDRAAYRPKVDAEKCQSCKDCAFISLCAANCPFGALATGPNGPILNKDRCMSCCSCMEWCPVKAIEMVPDPEIVEQLKAEEKANNVPMFD